MGSTFRLPIWPDVDYEGAIDWCRQKRIRVICADVRAQDDYTEVDWNLPTAIVMGAESEGLSREEIAKTDRAIRIPMKGQAESLNVAVAAGILLFETSRVRGN
jgi:TrmH family RNA methyltransferase